MFSTTLSVTTELIRDTMEREIERPIDAELTTALDTLQLLQLRQPDATGAVLDTDGSLVGEPGSQMFIGTPTSAPGIIHLPDHMPTDGKPVSVGGDDEGRDSTPFAHYRLLVRNLAPQTTVIVARDLHNSDASIHRVRKSVLIVQMSSGVVIALLSALIVRRELRPLERAAVAADRIAAGDYDVRLDKLSPSHTAPSSEVGRLSTALDRMLDEIQASFKARDQSEARLRQFVADASHELRTPLQSIRGYGELYQKGVLTDSSAVDQAIGRMLSEVARMANLVDQLLTLARLDELQEAELDHVDFSRVVSDSCHDAYAVEPHRPRRDLLTRDITVLGDEAQLRRLVANLLGNVRAHTPPTAACLVELVRVEDQAVLRVTDKGPGIPAEALPHVFDRFYRADTSRSRSTGGTGLGLALCAAIVHAHSGRIVVHSTEGEGTCVEICLPCVRAGTMDGG